MAKYLYWKKSELKTERKCSRTHPKLVVATKTIKQTDEEDEGEGVE